MSFPSACCVCLLSGGARGGGEGSSRGLVVDDEREEGALRHAQKPADGEQAAEVLHADKAQCADAEAEHHDRQHPARAVFLAQDAEHRRSEDVRHEEHGEAGVVLGSDQMQIAILAFPRLDLSSELKRYMTARTGRMRKSNLRTKRHSAAGLMGESSRTTSPSEKLVISTTSLLVPRSSLVSELGLVLRGDLNILCSSNYVLPKNSPRSPLKMGREIGFYTHVLALDTVMTHLQTSRSRDFAVSSFAW